MVVPPPQRPQRPDLELLELLRMSPLFPRLRTYYEENRMRREREARKRGYAMLSRARRVPFADTYLWLVDVNDWAALKLLEMKRVPLEAGRHITDIVLVNHVTPIDLRRVQGLARDVGVEEQYEQLMRLLEV